MHSRQFKLSAFESFYVQSVYNFELKEEKVDQKW